MHLLLPARHHLLTNHHLAYLTLLAHTDASALRDRHDRPVPHVGRFASFLWAITSANHGGTRRNPLPGHRREVAIEELSQQLDAPSFVYHIDDVGASFRFADYLLKKIAVDSRRRFALAPSDTLVATSTPELAEQFEALGFRVLDIDAGQAGAWKILEDLVAAGLAGDDWATHPLFLTKVARASRRLILKYGYDRSITDLHRHPLGTIDGDLTATRDYNVYVRAFDDGAERKAALIRDHVRPGRVVDIGCCTGSLLQQLTRDDRLRESDFYGIELARPLYQECMHRKAQGAFASPHVFFYQADIVERALFDAGSIDTFTTFSLTHELESYQGRDFLERFIALLADQLATGGRWLNVDVVGPDEPDAEVLLRLNAGDGRNDEPSDATDTMDRVRLKAHLVGLSTYGRFLQFARDFRREEGYRLAYRVVNIGADTFVELRLGDACEFLSKKDYLDNWRSEMHETFCFWSFADWKAAVERAGLAVLPASNAYVNPWIVSNRYEGKAGLFRAEDGQIVPMAWPVTNMLLAAEKR